MNVLQQLSILMYYVVQITPPQAPNNTQACIGIIFQYTAIENIQIVSLTGKILPL